MLKHLKLKLADLLAIMFEFCISKKKVTEHLSCLVTRSVSYTFSVE